MALWRYGFRSSSDSELQVAGKPRQRHDDHACSAVTLGRRASCGWLNGDAVVQRLERPGCTAQTSSRVLCVKTFVQHPAKLVRDPICHIEPVQLSVKELCQTAVVLPCASHDSRCVNGDIRRKSPIFPTPVYLTPSLNGFPLEFGIDARGHKNLNDGATRWSKKI